MTSISTKGPLGMLRKSALALCIGLAAFGCDEPEQDKFKSQGGISPDPTGIIAGSVLYSGPRPYCKTEKGMRRVQGRVVLTLFEYDNPPPPEGRASQPLNLKFINADELFTVSDCLPDGEVADPDGERITRTVDYSWPQIVLRPGRESVRYQMRGFYDTDEDMNLFSVKSLPTEGDIAGAALNDPVDADKGILAIAMPGIKDAPNGYRRQGVIISLGNYIWLERPVFKLNERRFMEANKTVIARQMPPPNSTELDLKLTLQELRGHTCNASLTCGLSLDQMTPDEFDAAAAAGDVQLDFSPDKYAFISEPVDVLTIRGDNAIDLARADGVPDPHPLLGSNLGIPWYTPIVIMTRLAPTQAMADIETRAGIPNVRLIGSVLMENAASPDEGPKPAKRTTLDSIAIAVPPVAAVELDPNNVQCRVPYLAPGNYTRAYESRFAICSDLPTGIYNVAALQGVAGGERNEAGPEQSDNGFVYDNGRFSSQAWTVPNELGDPLQFSKQNEGLAIASQSRAGAFVIFDRDVDNQGQCRTAQDPDNNLEVRAIEFNGICAPGEDPHTENKPGQPFEGVDGTHCLPDACCELVRHLCGVPLCEPCDEDKCPGLELGDDHPIRQGPTKIEKVTKEGKSIPNCLPFALPELCCPSDEG
jgi:hypothetical protein